MIVIGALQNALTDNCWCPCDRTIEKKNVTDVEIMSRTNGYREMNVGNVLL